MLMSKSYSKVQVAAEMVIFRVLKIIAIQYKVFVSLTLAKTT